MTAPSVRHRIHRATSPEDVVVGAALIATAFAPLPACEWLVPDPEERVRVLSSVFEIIVAHAVDHGEVHLLFASRGAEGPGPGLGIGAAVWIDQASGHQDARDPAPVVRGSDFLGSDFQGSVVPQPPDYDARLLTAAGEFTPRFTHLDKLFEAGHPDTPHHHLAFLAALPAHQNSGIASTLLSHHHAHLDRIGTPAYLEASSLDSRRLYVRHGYIPLGNDFALPNGAVFYRMWRPPTDASLI